MIYWRIEYNNIGIYEAFKMALWNKSKNPKEEWIKLKNSSVFNWLPVPTNKYENCKSFFSEQGYDSFIKYTYPKFIKYLDKNKIIIKKYKLENIDDKIVYQDLYQIVITE